MSDDSGHSANSGCSPGTGLHSKGDFKISLEKPSWALRDSYIECLRDLQEEDPSRTIKWALALGLEKARTRRMIEIQVTCDDDNLGSIATLEMNGGVLLETYEIEDWPKHVRRYRIGL